MLFSVVVPIYNVEKYLDKCINSIVNQTFKDFELILVDDGSTDNCLQICKKYELQNYNIIIVHKQNGGLVSARKAGTKVAKGEYIVPVDGDDWISKDYLEKFSNIINKYNPDVVCSNYYFSFNNKNVKFTLKFEEGFYNKERIVTDIFPILIEGKDGNYFSPNLWSKVYKKNIYIEEQLSVDDKIKIGEDGACTKPIMYKANSIYMMNDYLYYYRQNEESMTKNRKVFNWKVPKLIAKHISNRININEYDFKEQLNRSVVHNLFNICVSEFNTKDSYFTIRKRIIGYLKDDFYKKCIRECNTKTISKLGLALFCFRFRFIFMIKIYNLLKNIVRKKYLK